MGFLLLNGVCFFLFKQIDISHFYLKRCNCGCGLTAISICDVLNVTSDFKSVIKTFRVGYHNFKLFQKLNLPYVNDLRCLCFLKSFR